MLTRALVAAQFQDTDDAGEVNDGQEDRTFVQFAETARTGLVGRGVAVDRIYQRTTRRRTRSASTTARRYRHR